MPTSGLEKTGQPYLLVDVKQFSLEWISEQRVTPAQKRFLCGQELALVLEERREANVTGVE